MLLYFRIMNEPSVYVLVINWNGMEHVDACFRSLLDSSYTNARFILLDNGSDDGSDTYVEEQFAFDSRVKIWRLGTNLGWGGGNNAGIKRAMDEGADYVLLLNNDTWTAPDALEELVRQAEAYPGAGAFAPKMLLYDDPGILNSLGVEVSYIGSAWDIGIGEPDRPERHTSRPVPGVCGGAMFLRVSALREVGMLDPRFGIYYDDVDLCFRMWQGGYTCLSCPTAVFHHKFSATLGKGVRKKRALAERNRLRFLFLNFPFCYLLRFFPYLILAELRITGSALRSGETWVLGIQCAAWWRLMMSSGEILSLRRGRMKAEYVALFPKLITRECMFCPEISLPR